ncbi:hypothetical protein QQF64_020894 [Cirrhinus molitorella]|uniref:Uncharacterized protein n=1 Tax=Cirrhinus molitorella TaxID=172907 RepID=A0ABR3LAG3_9TELE
MFDLYNFQRHKVSISDDSWLEFFGLEFAPPPLFLPGSSPVLLTLHQRRKWGQRRPDTSSVFEEILSSPLNPLTPRVNRTRDRGASNPSGRRERERRGGAKPSGILYRSAALMR